MPPPDHRALKVLQAAARGDESDLVEAIECALFHLVKTGDSSSPEIGEALAIYEDDEYAHVFNALILANADEETAAGGIGVNTTTYSAYKYLFFDVQTFPHNLARARYVKRLQCEDEIRSLYEAALERGPSGIINRFRIGARPPLDPEAKIAETAAEMHDKFTAHRGYAVTSDIAKEALRWGEASLRAFKLALDNGRESRRSEGTVDDLRIALEIRNETNTPKELGLQVGDLVIE